MKEFKLLKFLDKFKNVFESNGIEYLVMRRILQVKLTMDERSVSTIMMNNKRQSGQKNAYRSTLFVYLLMGAFMGAFVFIPFPIYLKMNINMAMLIFMIMTTMISDFSTVLLDIEDKNILLPRPVDAKTLNMAKLIHILRYLLSITLAIAGGTLVCGVIRYGLIFLIIMLFELVLICGFVIFFTSIFYYAILSFFNGEKLKDIINYFQIALTISMTLIYQLIARIFNFTSMKVEAQTHIWDYFLPTAWFAAPFSMLIEHTWNRHYLILMLMGIIIPICTMIVYVKFVTPHFEQNLQKLNNSENAAKGNKKNALQRVISNLICKTRTEKAFFRFVYQMLGNERKLKLRIYPNIAFAVIFPFIFFMNMMGTNHSIQDAFAELAKGRSYFYIYYTVGMLSTLFPMVSLSENYQGAWIYRAMPIEKPAPILKGALKALLYKYIIPVYLVISCIYIAIFGVRILPDLVLIFINMIILILLAFLIGKKELPFYKDFQYAQNGSNTARILIMFLLCAVEALVHFLAITFIPFGIVVNFVLSFVIVISLWYFSFRFSWRDIVNE